MKPPAQKRKIMPIFGTRPEAIKMAPLVLALQNHPDMDCVVTVTGQHREQLDQVLASYNITPAHDLAIMKQGQTLADISTGILTHLTPILAQEKPDMVLVHGDTTTSFAAGLAAFYQQIAIGHVEAGLRSGDKYQPFPEEINRKLLTHVADLHLAPTTLSRRNLLAENITEHVYVTGNTAIDAIRHNPDHHYHIEPLNQVVANAKTNNHRVVLLTAHRRENLGEPLANICDAVNQLCQAYPQLRFVYPVHKNPVVRDTVYAKLADNPQVLLTEPLETADMHNLMSQSWLVLTDSGGLQEEAPFFDVPVLVLRAVTERPEGLETGVLKLVGTDSRSIVTGVSQLMDDPTTYTTMQTGKNPYGDGQASERIVECIRYYYGQRETPPVSFS